MVTVLELGQTKTSIRIEEVLTPDETFEQSEAQTTLTTSAKARTSSVCVSTDGTPRVGDSALAVLGFYSAALDSGMSQRILGSVTLFPWTDALRLGNGEPTPLSELVELTDMEVCDARFPPPQLGECRDDEGGGGGCAMHSTNRTSGPHGIWAMLGSILLLLARRGRRQQS